MLVYYLSVVLALTHFIHCVDLNDESGKIFGGTVARRGQFPYMVSVRQLERLPNGKLEYTHGCGGAILNEHWILTAAHCFQSQNVSSVVIVTGAHHYRKDGQIYALDRIVEHPEHKGGHWGYDIALAHTNRSIAFNSKVQKIPIQTERVGGNVSAIVPGWGWTSVEQPVRKFSEFVSLYYI